MTITQKVGAVLDFAGRKSNWAAVVFGGYLDFINGWAIIKIVTGTASPIVRSNMNSKVTKS